MSCSIDARTNLCFIKHYFLDYPGPSSDKETDIYDNRGRTKNLLQCSQVLISFNSLKEPILRLPLLVRFPIRKCIQS